MLEVGAGTTGGAPMVLSADDRHLFFMKQYTDLVWLRYVIRYVLCQKPCYSMENAPKTFSGKTLTFLDAKCRGDGTRNGQMGAPHQPRSRDHSHSRHIVLFLFVQVLNPRFK